MKSTRVGAALAAVSLLVHIHGGYGLSPPNRTELGGTSWQLVNIQGGDGTALKPDDKSKSSIAFATDGRMGTLMDGDRGHEHNEVALALVRNWGPATATAGIPCTLPRAGTAAAPLENTYWKLISLEGSPVTVAAGQQEPHLILNSESRHVAGSGGCNRLEGSYVIDGGRLTLGVVVTTMMACQTGMETEEEFLDALRAVRKWNIKGQQLDLLGGSGSHVARFEAHHMK